MNHIIGKEGELLAISFLERNRYRICATNFTAPIGKSSTGKTILGEIDIIAFDGQVLCFIEVKTRSYLGLYAPQDAVDAAKKLNIALTARKYLRLVGWKYKPYRFDVVTVILQQGSAPKLEILKNYFADPLRK
ncbi:MAG: YraN family protein [Acidobacteriota bacterium]|nr:YraN family protein [Blastocatellia bacterium]MDW8411701.1 YraN family protein [Acidobacteriota bacterium]